MSAGVEEREGGSKYGRESSGENSPCPSLLFVLEGLLPLQLFHKSDGDLLFPRVRFSGGNGSRHPEIPRMVDRDSAPGESDA